MQLFLSVLSADPTARFLQLLLLGAGSVAVYLICYTTRDILLRSRSFLYQALSILLVTILPVVGFFLYLLIRPARTVRERELEEMVRSLLPSPKEVEPQPAPARKEKGE
ncbi:MAG: PLD nuclease N-terminal domain-containing protein [Candidatus Peribacteraceae bacterium]|jgi:hypothetical protein